MAAQRRKPLTRFSNFRWILGHPLPQYHRRQPLWNESAKGEAVIAEDNITNDSQAYGQPPEPAPDLESLDRLVGTWEHSEEVQGTSTFEWMEGGFVLTQRVGLEQHGQRVRVIDVIGQLRPFGEEPSEDIRSRFYDSAGNTLDYVYELEGDTLTIWAGRRVPRRTPRAPSATTATHVPAPGTTREAAATNGP